MHLQRAIIEPIVEAIPAARQEDARHYGVHPYFTRRPANVVRANLERYSQPGDTVLDPFGGTGVAAIEAFLIGRHAVQNDLNPFANFVASNIADTTLASTVPLKNAFQEVESHCATGLREIEASEEAAGEWLKRLPLPENIRLPSNSDAEFFYDMFTPRQLAGLALIKEGIELQPSGAARNMLLLAWSASIAKLNKTFLSAKGRADSRGGSSIFSIYRYKLASRWVELPIWETFAGRFRNVLAAKDEVPRLRDFRAKGHGGGERLDSARDFHVFAQDAATLDSTIEASSVDYIFTDPPYGAFISYLDLSILWNHWLGFTVSETAKGQETIVGGEAKHTEEHYKRALAQSVSTAFRLLKPDRWASIVFQHWDISYFAVILETAAQSGAELKAAITQTGDVIWSMHKKKNSVSVLAGEMILTFYKPLQPMTPRPRENAGEIGNPAQILGQTLDRCLENTAATFTTEALFNRLVMDLWARQALNCLNLDRQEFIEQLEQRGWVYSARSHLWRRLGQPNRARGELMLFEGDDR